MNFGRALTATVALLALSATPSAAATDFVSISVVDLPRAEDKWGYAPATRRIQLTSAVAGRTTTAAGLPAKGSDVKASICRKGSGIDRT